MRAKKTFYTVLFLFTVFKMFICFCGKDSVDDFYKDPVLFPGTGVGTTTGIGTGTATGVNQPPTFGFSNINPTITCSYLSSGFIHGTADDSDGTVHTVLYSLDGGTASFTTGDTDWKIMIPVGTTAVVSGSNTWQDYTTHTLQLYVCDNYGLCDTSTTITFIKGLNKDFNGNGYADVIVGAIGVASDKGAVYIYHGDSTGVDNIVDTTLNGEGTASDQFGWSVASCGDVNGDGYADAIVGVPYYGSSKGAAYIFHGGSGGANNTTDTKLNGSGASDQFGYSVASCGDVNGDGYADIIVGAIGAGTSSTGATYIHYSNGTSIVTTAGTTLTGSASGDRFGISVASCGNVNGDCYSDVIVGADGVGTSDTGAAYIYHGSNTGANNTADTTLTGSSGRFGTAVGSGDINGNGYADAIVGADTYGAGETYIFYSSGTAGINSSSSTNASVTLQGASTANCFGCSVNSGDVNGDNCADVIVGADYVSGETGAAYVFHGSSTFTDTVPAGDANTTLTGSATTDYFGHSVASCGDVNGDGYADVIVGAYGVSVSGDAGAAYIYHGGSGGVGSSANVTLQDSTDGDKFGYSVN